MADHTPQRAKSRLEPWRKRYALVSDILTPQRLGLLVGAGVLLLSGALGGWQAVVEDESEIPVAQVATDVDATPFRLHVKSVRHATELGSIARKKDDVRYLFVVVDVTNTSDDTVMATVLPDAVDLHADGLADRTSTHPMVYRVNDGLLARGYAAGVTVPTVLVFEQDAATPLPAEVRVDLLTHAWHTSIMDGSQSWSRPATTHTMTVPVQPLADG